MKKNLKQKDAFSLAEMIVTLTVASMVLIAVMTIYTRTQRTAASITQKVTGTRMTDEVLQSIARDLDNVLGAGTNATIKIKNSVDQGYNTAQLKILKTFYNEKNENETFEEIIWQANYNENSDVNGLVLYRSHSGVTVEDKLLEEKRQDWEKDYPFVPMCKGITFFSLEVIKGNKLLDTWDSNTLPLGILATISFAQPVKTARNTLEIPEEEKVSRTIAVDKARKLNLVIVPKIYGNEANDINNIMDANKVEDVNKIQDTNQPAEPNSAQKQNQPSIFNKGNVSEKGTTGQR